MYYKYVSEVTVYEMLVRGPHRNKRSSMPWHWYILFTALYLYIYAIHKLYIHQCMMNIF